MAKAGKLSRCRQHVPHEDQCTKKPPQIARSNRREIGLPFATLKGFAKGSNVFLGSFSAIQRQWVGDQPVPHGKGDDGEPLTGDDGVDF